MFCVFAALRQLQIGLQHDLKREEFLNLNAVGRVVGDRMHVRNEQKNQTTCRAIFVDCQQEERSSPLATSTLGFNTALPKTLAKPCQGRNESTLTPGSRRISTFPPTDSNSSQVADRQMPFGNSTRNLRTSIRSSRHKRNSRHSVFACPALIPETRPGCGTLTDDDGITH
jgi:hypothetical protein